MVDGRADDLELREMRRTRDRLAIAPMRPVGAGWRERRAEQLAALDKHIERCALTEPGANVSGVDEVAPPGDRVAPVTAPATAPGSVSARQEGER